MRSTVEAFVRATFGGRSAVRTIAVLASATGAAQLIAVTSSPFLTRLYTPAEFGVYAAAISLVSIVGAVACLRYELAIPLPQDSEMAVSLIVLCLMLTGIVTFITALVLVVLGDVIGEVLGIQGLLQPLLPPILLAILGVGAYSALSAWAVRVAEFGQLARTRLTQAIGLVGLQLGLGIIGMGAPGLLLGDAVGRFGGTRRLAALVWRREAGAFRQVTRSSLRSALVRYRRFALISTPSTIIDVVTGQAPMIILLALFGPVVGGWFYLAMRVGSVPNGLIAASVAPMYLAEAARAGRVNMVRQRALFDRTVRRLFLFGLIPAGVLALGAPVTFPLLFGSEWSEAGWCAAILAPMFLAQLVSSPVSGILDVLERQELHLARELVAIAILACAVVVGLLVRPAPLGFVALLSLGGAINALTYLLFMRLALDAGPVEPVTGGMADEAPR